ncbi:MAG: aldo/keto reductase [Thermomicrobiales bacterium]|nr:aldo/keto reductase [Thermomicrobiales bacterium]MCO5221986.1 aldo/keto reductase [Thermomicrobiales bacterium]
MSEGGRMKYGQITGIDKPIARIVQGTTMLDPGDIDASFALLDAIVEQGGTTFDTAQSYLDGNAERILGRWMAARRNHDRVLVITKGCHHTQDRQRVTPFDLTADLHDSLARLGVERIDLYFLHRDNPDIPVEELIGVLDAHIGAGKIGAIGASNWSIERIQEANRYAREQGMQPFVASSPNFSLADQVTAPWPSTVSISGPRAADARAWYRTTRMPIFAWSSLAHGFWSGLVRSEMRDGPVDGLDPFMLEIYGSPENFERLCRAEILAAERECSVAQIALAFILEQQCDVYAVSGSRSPGEFAENVAALDVTLSNAELDWLDLLANER